MRIQLKLTAAVIAAVSVLFSVAPASAGTGSGFGDVNDDAYFADAVAWLVDAEITTGIETGCFGPFDNLTRGQVAAFMFRLDVALGNSPSPGPNPFTDVTAAYQIGPVGWMFAEGITTGTTSTTFSPSDAITRGDFATLLWRYAGRPTGSPSHPFTDVAAGYQQDAVSWMADLEITTGTTATTFDPNGLVTRAQAATFFFRFAKPGSVAAPTEIADCDRPLRLALIAGGLTADEAACAAPHLSGFSVEYLDGVVSREIAPSTILLDALADIYSQGCLSDSRVAELIQSFF